MRKILILVVFVLAFESNAQDNPIIGSMMVTFSSTSNVEDSEFSIEQMNHLIITDEKKNGVIFTNTFLKKETKSEGKIYNVSLIPSQKKSVIHYQMDWRYQNNYNTNNGIAKINIYIEEIEDKEYTHWAKIKITDHKGLDLAYSGPFFYYIHPLAFGYILEEKTKKND